MSAQAINYLLLNSFASNERLAVYYDFTVNNAAAEGSGPYTGLLFNAYPAFDEGKYSATLLNITGATITGVEAQLSGLFSTNILDLTKTNIEIPITDLNINDFSFLVDFEFKGAVTDGVIFGSFEKFQETVNGVNYTGTNGFNIGVDTRGHLFIQTYGSDGDEITTFSNSELSRRNIIGVTSYGNSIVLSKIDYLNNEIESLEIPTEQNYLSNPDYFYFGGSKKYYSSINEKTRTCSGIINKLAIFSGAVSDTYMQYIGSGFIGDYFYTGYSPTANYRVTGYVDSIVYKTGVTGYDYQTTGTLTIATGREYITGYATSSSTTSKTEGERYYKYYTLDNGLSKTYYKEELGHLHPNSGYVYYPTGEGAYATLGLQNAASSITTYIVSEVTGQPSTTINLYGKIALTGVLNEVSGVVQTPLVETYYTTQDPVSGIIFTGDASKFKKDYIYYLGERLS